MYSNGKLSGCVDDGVNDGHRANIMTVNGEVGCGLIRLGTKLIHTCNQGGNVQSPSVYSALTVFAGAHVFIPGSTITKYRFMVRRCAAPCVGSLVLADTLSPAHRPTTTLPLAL